jgi:hypothetical protein
MRDWTGTRVLVLLVASTGSLRRLGSLVVVAVGAEYP